MGIEENKEVVERFIEGMSKGDSSIVDELTTGNYLFHLIRIGDDFGREFIKRQIVNSLIANSDFMITIDDMVIGEDKVAGRTTMRGTQTGQVRTIAPTGKSFEIARLMIFHFEDGKIAEMWNLNDRLSMYQQLGLLPPTKEIEK